MPSALSLTANLQDFTSASEGEGALIIALCNFGSVIPRVTGTSLIAEAGPDRIEAVAGVVTTQVWGNDVITPQGTYYCIEVCDENGDVVQCSLYQFSGSATIDLSQAAPIDPNIGVPPFQFATSDVFIILPSLSDQERQSFSALMKRMSEAGLDVPSPGGTAPANVASFSAPPGTTYTLTYTPYLGFLLGLYYNGNLLIPGLHYSLTGKTITLSFSTGIGDNLCAVYVGTQ